jgi:hypothetical protein
LNYFPKDLKKPGRCDVMELDPKDSVALDLSKEFALFNGNCAHGVQAFSGERFSLVFFTTANFHKIQQKEQKELARLGFKFPTMSSVARVKSVSWKVDRQREQLLKRR